MPSSHDLSPFSLCKKKRSKGGREINGMALGAEMVSFSRVMQQGQPDDEDKLGASKKTSVRGGNLIGKWVMKNWVRGLFRTGRK